MRKGTKLILISVSLILILSISFVSAGFFSDLWNKVTGKATSFVCGNDIIDPGEHCDGDSWGPITGCSDFGFAAGTLICGSNCFFDTSQCLESPIEPEVCITIYEPVCGVDGVTYSNSCFAGLENVEVDCVGECPCEIELPPEESPLPNVQFVSPTTAEGNFIQTFIEVNVTATDSLIGLDTITITLFDSTNLVQQNTSLISPLFVNFTNLPYETYFLNATANNTEGNENQTETRTIVLVTELPDTGAIEPPQTTRETTETTETCADTDNGIKYNKKGSAIDGSGNSLEDSCVSGGLYDGQLQEYFCGDEYNAQYGNNLDFKYYNCPNGCKDGECITQNIFAVVVNFIKNIFSGGDKVREKNQFVLVKTDSNLIYTAKEIALRNNYDILEVTGGIEEIRNQIIEFVSNSENKYEFMVIFGDSDQIPVYNKEKLEELLTSQGVTPNDPNVANNPLDSIYYGNIDNDPLIELAVGRIPFSNERDIEDYYNNFMDTKQINTINVVRWLSDTAPLGISEIKLQFINYNVNNYQESDILLKDEINSFLTSSDLFQYHSHGSNVAFAIGGGYSYVSADIPDLTANDPIILSGACYNANGIGKDFIKKGALSYIGFVVPGPNTNAKPFLPSNSEDTIGSSMTKAINYDIVRTIASGGNTAYFSPIYILYGDPSLKIEVSPLDPNWKTNIDFDSNQIVIEFPPAKSFTRYIGEKKNIFLSADEIRYSDAENIFNNIKNGEYYDPGRSLIVKCDPNINDDACRNLEDAGYENIPFEYGVIRATGADPRKFFVRNLYEIPGLNIGEIEGASIEIDGNSIPLSNEARYGILENGDEKYLFFGEATRDGVNIVKNNGWERGRKIILQFSITQTCIDSDGGKNYYVNSDCQDSRGIMSDGCIESDSDKDGWLREITCDDRGNGVLCQMNDYECPNGCEEGACMNATERDTTPPLIFVEESSPLSEELEKKVIVRCEDDIGCDTSSYKHKIYQSSIDSCPTIVSEYDEGAEAPILLDLWVCGYGKDLAGNEAFSSPTYFEGQELTCTEGICMTQDYDCFSRCKDGKCIKQSRFDKVVNSIRKFLGRDYKPPEEVSPEEEHYYHKATCSDSEGNSIEDTCIDDNTLREAYCGGYKRDQTEPIFIPPAYTITSPEGYITVGVNKRYGGAIVYYRDNRIGGNIIDYSNAGTLFTTPIWTLPIDTNEQQYCYESQKINSVCPSSLSFNNPTQGGYYGNGYAGNPNIVDIRVQNNNMYVSFRGVNYNFAYDASQKGNDPRSPYPIEQNKEEWQTDFWQDIEISFHPSLTDVVIIDTNVTYCKDRDSSCNNKNIVTQDNQLSTLFAAGQSHPDTSFRGPFTRTAYHKEGGFAYFKDNKLITDNDENWIAILKETENVGIGLGVQNYEPTDKTRFGISVTSWPSIAYIQPELNRFETRGVIRKESVIVDGVAYSDIIRYEFEPGGWYMFRTYVATGNLNNIRENLLLAQGQVLVECTDTDEGINYEIRGEIYVDGVYHNEDKCTSPYDGSLNEWYCDGSVQNVERYECPNSCEDGACVSLPHEHPPRDGVER